MRSKSTRPTSLRTPGISAARLHLGISLFSCSFSRGIWVCVRPFAPAQNARLLFTVFSFSHARVVSGFQLRFRDLFLKRCKTSFKTCLSRSVLRASQGCFGCPKPLLLSPLAELVRARLASIYHCNSRSETSVAGSRSETAVTQPGELNLYLVPKGEAF